MGGLRPVGILGNHYFKKSRYFQVLCIGLVPYFRYMKIIIRYIAFSAKNLLFLQLD